MSLSTGRWFRRMIFALSPISCCFGQQYDLLLQRGHVIDAKNHISGIRDVAIQDGKIAAVAEHIDPAQSSKTVDVRGLYVTPGLVDIHVHVYASLVGPNGGERNRWLAA